jgi:uncharacterized protein
VDLYSWPARDAFLNRAEELADLERWWGAAPSRHINLYGRRRVGKSWLFRAFADGKPALIMTANERGARDQLAHFAEQMEPVLGIRPGFGDDFGRFFRTLPPSAAATRC